MLNPGDQAPDFTLPDQHGAHRSLGDLLDSGNLLLYFYPADFSPVCTAQACQIRDQQARMLDAGLRVAGVSTQSVRSHARFAERFGLDFPVLSDPDKRVCRAYGVLGPFGWWTNRVSYRIGADRRIVDAVRAGIQLGRHRRLMVGDR